MGEYRKLDTIKLSFHNDIFIITITYLFQAELSNGLISRWASQKRKGLLLPFQMTNELNEFDTLVNWVYAYDECNISD